MTDNEIIKAASHCIDDSIETCEFCPFRMQCERGERIFKYVLELVCRQTAEIEQLTRRYNLSVAEREANIKGFTEQFASFKTEVAREIFAMIDILGTYNPTMYDEFKKKYTGANDENNA